MTQFPNRQSLPYVTRDQLAFEEGKAFSLRVILYTLQTEKVDIRGYTREGPFIFRVTPAGDGTAESFTFRLPDIPIAVSVDLTTASGVNAVGYATMHLVVDGDRVVLLGSGYFAAGYGVTWPYQIPSAAPQIFAPLVTVLMTNPAAGAELSYQVPANFSFEILSLGVTLVTSATAIDRTPTFYFPIGTGGNIVRASTVTQQASETITYTLVPEGTSGVTVTNQDTEIAIPRGIIVPGGYSITSTTTNFQAGDNYGIPRLWVRIHFTPGV